MPLRGASRVEVELSPDSNIARTVKPFELKFAPDSAREGSFSGYGAITASLDDGGDVIERGAFTRTLAEAKAAGRMPKMFINHAGIQFGTTSANDAIPIGVWDHIAEDSKGLAVEGHLISLDTERGRLIHGAMKEGAIDSLSIGYKTVRSTPGPKPARRTIHELKLYEISPVTMPMQPLARITAVKSAAQITEVRVFEEFLRDAGFPRAFAKAIAAKGFKAAAGLRDDDGAAISDLAAAMRMSAAAITQLIQG